MKPYLLGHQRGVTSDLDVSVMEAEELVQVCWQYDTDLFNADTIARMAGHFQTLLLAIATNPEQQISELPLLTQTERQQLLFEPTFRTLTVIKGFLLFNLLTVRVK